jgi:DNA-binding NarL/FixJ family response regulator
VACDQCHSYPLRGEIVKAFIVLKKGYENSPLLIEEIRKFVRYKLAAHAAPREIEVLELASQGNPNKAIAKKLFITEATVKSHFVHIFSKLGVTDRTAAVTEAVKKKIIKI